MLRSHPVLLSLVVLLLARCSSGFTVGFPAQRHHRTSTPSLLHLSRDDASRFEGNQRLPSAQELSLMDEMIDRLAEAKPYELPSAVKRAFKVLRSPQFFMRIAQRVDEEPERKEQLEALATNLVTTLQAVVETTEEQLDERAQQVQAVVAEAAEPDNGEFLVPLAPARISAMRTKLQALPAHNLDEGFLTTLDTWIVKAHSDGMDLMVGILQKTLQMYAGLQIQRALEAKDGEAATTTDGNSLLFRLLQADAEQEWTPVLDSLSSEELNVLKTSLQTCMESIILSLETGSMAQQVQAEYLKELLQQVETKTGAAPAQ